MARKKKHPEHVNHERWIVSYADFITLLFAFFTTLYAISTVDAKKAGKLVYSMRSAFNMDFFPSAEPVLGGAGPADESWAQGIPRKRDRMVLAGKPSDRCEERGPRKPKGDKDGRGLKDKRGLGEGEQAGDTKGRHKEPPVIDTLRRALRDLITREDVMGKVRLRTDPRGLVITMEETGFFEPGSAELRSDAAGVLRELGTMLASSAMQLRIEGHTDNSGSGGGSRANWELSAERAVSIVEYLVSRFDYRPDLLGATGYGEYRPIASNATAEGRARNRRVDIVVLNEGLDAE